MASSSLLAILLIAVATIQVAFATYYSTCDPPSKPENGRYDPYKTKYYVGSKITFVCNSGYRRYGPSWSICREYNKRVFWSHPPPVCKPIPRCGKLGHPLYGNMKVSGYTHGSSAYYTCNSGYRLVGNAYRRCYNGQWNGKEPVCDKIIIVKCPSRDHPQYGYVKVTGYYPGSTAYYQCRKGYEIYGDARQTCLDTGYWGGKIPVCKKIVRCPDLYDPPYGSVNQTDNKPGLTAQYECDYGFKLVGDARRKCLYNGYWSGKEPVCKPILCPDLYDPPYGSVKMTGNKPGSTAYYECKYGFKLVGDAWRKCLYNGYWSGEEPVCKKIVRCPDLYDPPYGSVNQTGNTPGSSAQYECDDGFKLVGDDYRECLKTGYWSGEEPICKKIIWCPDLDNPEYGRVDQNGNKLGSTAYYECNKGFKLVGDEYRECLYTGYWNGKKPVCKRAICPYLVDPQYGKVNQRGNTPSSVAYYSCSYGYALHGLRYRKCLYDGTWYGDAPECRPVVKKFTCPPLDKPRYGKVRVSGYTPYSKAYYSCNDGYKLYGLQWRKCLSSGSWYGSAPTCRPTRY